ncbi:MAG: MGMT family protein [Candidatus Kerfeldbacteria bacterium]|nr:MGMT family protein [Candidatus Kerfeldbacteria bacterium]
MARLKYQPNFYVRVYAAVRKIPCGRVTTYGQIAAMCGSPRGAQLVGWALNALNNLGPQTRVPWQRVINREGRISIENRNASKDLQAALLRAEGVEVEFRDGNYWVDLRHYLWDAQGEKD